MPSISAERLKELNDQIDLARREADRIRSERDHLIRQRDEFSTILTKITRAAQGASLEDDRGTGWGYNGGANYDLVSGGGVDNLRLTDAERHEREVDRLTQRIVVLETRIAAVVALAQFAKVHRA